MNKIKKILPYLINALIITAIFIGVLLISKASPFGNYILGKSDAISQYKPMLFNFITNLKKGTIDIYSFNNGLGNPFIFNYIYYLISPLNLIALLFKKADHMFLSVIIIKLIITTINVTYYTRQKTKSNLVALIASLSYVFSTWLTSYYFNIMWLDTFMIFPLFQLGLERIINNKPLTYILTTAYLIVTNFYLSFSVLIYGVVYLIIVNFFYQKKTFKEKLKTTFFYILANIASAILLTGFIYIIFNVKNKMNLSFSSIEYTDYNSSIIDFLKALFYGNSVITLKEITTFPNIAMNSLILIGTIFTFINKKISMRDKIFIAIGMILATSCFFIKKIDFIINFFHNINGLTYRYTFIFNFLLIALFIKNTQNMDYKALKKIPFISLVLLLLLITIHKTMSTKIFLLNITFIILFTILSLFYKKDNKTIQIITVALIIIQTSVISYFIIPNNTTNDEFPILENFTTEKDHFRLNYLPDEKTYFNQNLYKNIDTTLLFSTMTYKNVITTFANLGCMTDVSTVYCDDENQIVSLLFNVNTNNQYLEKIYAVNSNITKTILIDDNIKFSQEELIKNISGIENIFNKETLKGKLEDDVYKYQTDHNYYIIEYPNEDGSTETYVQTYTEFEIDQDSNRDTFNIYTLNEKKYQEIYKYLAKNQINYTHYQDSHLEGTINVDDNQMIFTSIPYDESWEIKIDDKVVKPTKVLNSLIGIKVEPGEHKLSMKYKTNYKKYLIISLITLLVILLFSLYPKKKEI